MHQHDDLLIIAISGTKSRKVDVFLPCGAAPLLGAASAIRMDEGRHDDMVERASGDKAAVTDKGAANAHNVVIVVVAGDFVLVVDRVVELVSIVSI